MSIEKSKTIKENVHRFDDDVRKTGAYVYTSDKISSKYANSRISEAIKENYSFTDRSILDIGCGDGTYTLEFPPLGVKEILGIDPAEEAVKSANIKARDANFNDIAKFEVGDIYNLNKQLNGRYFDCVILRGVLHHLPDPEKAIKCISSLADTIIILEPNGYNPVLKLLERFSQYHIDHEERSFFPSTLQSWCKKAGLEIQTTQMINLVPMFCPNWMAQTFKILEPVVERIPLVRQIGCGQNIIVANK